MAVLNAHTTVPATQTIAEIELVLFEHGARSTTRRSGADGTVALSFSLQTRFGLQWFTLPVNAEAMQKLLETEYMKGRVDRRQTTIEHARAVAWRQIFVWIKAQLALIEVGQVSLDQVMLPWLELPNGETLYGELGRYLALPAGKED